MRFHPRLQTCRNFVFCAVLDCLCEESHSRESTERYQALFYHPPPPLLLPLPFPPYVLWTPYAFIRAARHWLTTCVSLKWSLSTKACCKILCFTNINHGTRQGCCMCVCAQSTCCLHTCTIYRNSLPSIVCSTEQLRSERSAESSANLRRGHIIPYHWHNDIK